MRTFLVHILLIMSLAAQAGHAQQSATAAVTPNELRNLAAQNVVNGNPQVGYQMAQALLVRNPNDIEALVIRARAARDMGRTQEALETARIAWRGAKSSNEKFGASMVMAQALSSAGSQTRAQLWLRRAAQNAPSEDLKAAAIRDFRYVRRSNPWATELSFSISPSSNINNGSQRASTRLFDLPFEFQLNGAARALSGVQYSYGVATRYRLSESARQQNDLLFRLNHQTYTMSDDAKRLAPAASGSDFAFSSLAASYIRRGFSSAGNDLPNQFELTLGKTLYGHQPFMDYARVAFTQNYVVAPGTFLFGGASFERQVSRSARSDVDIWGLSAGMRMRAGGGNTVTLSMDGKRSTAIDANLDYQQVTMRARYALGQPILGMAIDFGVSASQKNHDRSRFSRFGRRDKQLTADVTAVFTQIEYFGFSPSVTVSARRTKSTIGLYDSQGLGIRMGIQSAF